MISLYVKLVEKSAETQTTTRLASLTPNSEDLSSSSSVPDLNEYKLHKGGRFFALSGSNNLMTTFHLVSQFLHAYHRKAKVFRIIEY